MFSSMNMSKVEGCQNGCPSITPTVVPYISTSDVVSVPIPDAQIVCSYPGMFLTYIRKG